MTRDRNVLCSTIGLCLLAFHRFACGAVAVSPAVIDVGVIAPGAVRTVHLSVTNAGKTPLQLLAAEPECTGCTRVDFKPTSLAPGKSLDLPVTFQPPANDNGHIARSVTLRTDDSKEPAIKIPLNAFVTMSAGVWPDVFSVSLPKAPGSDVEVIAELVNVSAQVLTPLYATGPLDGPQLAVPHDPIPPGGKVTLRAKWHLPAKAGKITGQLILYVDHPQLAQITIPYQAVVRSSPPATQAVGAVKTTELSDQTGNTTSATGAVQASGNVMGAAAGVQENRFSAATQDSKAIKKEDVPSLSAAAPAAMIHLDLKESLPLKDFVDIVAGQLNINLIYDEAALSAPVSIRLSGPLPADALLPLLKTLLQAKGLALVATDRADIWRIVTSREAQLLTAPGAPTGNKEPGQIATEFLVPKSIDLETAASLLRGFVTPNVGQITPVPRIKSLIVTDYTSQVERLKRMMESIDKPTESARVEVVPIKAAEPGPLADRITKLLGQIGKAEGGNLFENVYISVSEDGSDKGALVLVGPESELGRVAALVKQFDTAPSLVRAEYGVNEQQRTEALDVCRQVLGRAAGGQSPDGTSRIITGPQRISVLATEGQHRRIKELLAGVLSSSDSHAVELRAYRIQNRDATELYATLSRLLGENRGAASALEIATQSPAISTEGISRVGNPPGTASTATQPASPESAAAFPSRPGSSSPINITIDQGTNTLLIAADAPAHERLGTLIKELDRKQAQVLLEVMLVSVADSDTFAAAVEAAVKANFAGSTIGIGTDAGIGTGDFINGRSPIVASGFNAAIFNPASFSVFMNALEQTNKARVLSVPQVLALDNKAALLRSTQDQPFTSVNASTTVATTSFGGFAEAGTTLEMTPHIAPGDYLNLEYHLEVSSFTGSASSNGVPPPRQSDAINSFVSVPDGSTVVLGGLRSSSVAKNVAKVPGLGEIPILGWIGRNENDATSNSTFYVFVRPTILRAAEFEDLKAASVGPKRAGDVKNDYPETIPHYMGN